MRNSAVQSIPNHQNQISTLVLEGDYCAEHEWGILPILQKSGIKPLVFESSEFPQGYPESYTGPWGFDRNCVNSSSPSRWKSPTKESPEGNIVLTLSKETKTKAPGAFLFAQANHAFSPEEIPAPHKISSKNYRPYQGSFVEYNKSEITRLAQSAEKRGVLNWDRHTTSAWDNTGFSILTRDPDTIEFLKIIYSSLLSKPQPESKTLGIWLGGAGNNPFSRNGLVLSIKELTDPENLQTLQASEESTAKTHWMAVHTGIYSIVPKSKYFALQPGNVLKSRNHDNPIYQEIPPTKHPLMFFLNPMDQKNNNCGWFTVEELTAWMNGEPNPITKI